MTFIIDRIHIGDHSDARIDDSMERHEGSKAYDLEKGCPPYTDDAAPPPYTPKRTVLETFSHAMGKIINCSFILIVCLQFYVLAVDPQLLLLLWGFFGAADFLRGIFKQIALADTPIVWKDLIRVSRMGISFSIMLCCWIGMPSTYSIE